MNACHVVQTILDEKFGKFSNSIQQNNVVNIKEAKPFTLLYNTLNLIRR
jgi:hypothetical protein